MLLRDRLGRGEPLFSFEFFPPKTDKGEKVLWRSLQRLAPLRPDFVSVTYGAGGSTRDRTLELVIRIQRELGLETVAHLTCVGATRDDLARLIDDLGHRGIHNILALRGDPPAGSSSFSAVPGGLRHASDLVALIRERGDFCVGAACYPEVHPEAGTAALDLDHLRTKVDAGVDFLVSQLFFDNHRFLDFTAQARAAGIRVPILAGIMPVTNLQQIERFTQTIGASLPEGLRERLREAEDDEHEVFWAGVSYAARQCRGLLAPGSAAGIHFYTLNRSPATRAIFEILQLHRADPGGG